MPLTHITRGLTAEQIIRAGILQPEMCARFKRPLAYFFYARPAYRVSEAEVVKLEAACPFCFVFRPELIDRADNIHAFDTGAFFKRLYSHVLTEDFRVEDYSLGTDTLRPNKLISATFGSMDVYFNGDRTRMRDIDEVSSPWQLLTRGYLELIASMGRNEPDDRICSIEVMLTESVALRRNLQAVVVPHTIWNETGRAPWLEDLERDGAAIVPYMFIPGRHPEHYHAQLEAAVRDLYKKWGLPV